MTKNALIIGAGPAGLTAAYYLLKETDIHPIILESEPVVGGISKTVEHNGHLVDLGGHRFFSKYQEVTNLWESLCAPQNAPARDEILLHKDKKYPTTGLNPETEENVFLTRDRVSRIFFLRKFFDYPISMKPATFINMGLFNTMKAGLGYLYSTVFKRREDSLENFYINRFGRPLYSMFFENYTEKLWGKHPREISPDWGAQRVKGLSLSKAIFNALFKPKKKETSLIESFSYPKRGCGQMWELLAQRVVSMGAELITNATVTKLDATADHLTAVTAIVNGEPKQFTADYFFSSMPIKDLIATMDNVPASVRETADGLPYRDFMTVAVLVPKLKIKNETKIKTLNDLIPDTWVYVQEPDLKMCRFQIFNNWSPYMVKDPEHTVWIGLEYVCDERDDLWNQSDEAFKNFAINELDSIGIIDKNTVLDAVRIKIKKAYPAYFGTYKNFAEVRTYLNRFDNLYCIGRNGQHRYNNMDHSMLTAKEAVLSLKNGTEKSVIWNVNADKEYHEEKKN